MEHLINDIALMVLAGVLAFTAGLFNGLMEISMGFFKESKISHWNPEFWELFGTGQAWRNKFKQRDMYSKIRNSWVIPILGKKFNIPKPMCILTGYHLSKMFWALINASAVIPIAIICHDENTAILCSCLLYFPQFAGWYLSFNFLLKKS